jgi:hypothetical protein
VDEQRLQAGALLRWARAGLLSGTVLTVSALAHTSAGGMLPSVLVLVGLTGATTLILAAVLGRPAGRIRVVGLLAGGQAVLHLAMTVLSGHTPAPVAVHAHHHVHAPTSALSAHAEASPDLLGTWLSHLQDDLSGPNLAMACAHMVAAVVLGWWLASGERALWGLIRVWVMSGRLLLLARRAAVALRALPAGVDADDITRPVSRGPERVQPQHRLLLACAVVRRGPPRWVSA